MRDIETCRICEPSFHCTGSGEKRRYFFPMIQEYVWTAESITDCPLFREKIELVPADKEKEQPKLVNQKTGESYESL